MTVNIFNVVCVIRIHVYGLREKKTRMFLPSLPDVREQLKYAVLTDLGANVSE